MFSQRGAHAYAQIGVETGVASASPHRLILMLYDGAMKAINEALGHLASGNTAGKGEAVSRAIGVIEQGLKASLDGAQGGAIALQLAELYDYMNRRLLLSSMRNEAAGFHEVSGLLRELREAWEAIETSTANAAAASAARYTTA